MLAKEADIEERRQNTYQKLFGPPPNPRDNFESTNNTRRKDQKNTRFKENRKRRQAIAQNKENSIPKRQDTIMEENKDKETKNVLDADTKSICWNVCKNIIYLEKLQQPIPLRITEEISSHQAKIDLILKEIEKLRTQSKILRRSELDKTILFDKYNYYGGKAVVIENNETFIYNVKITKRGFYLINVKGTFINYKHFYLQFREKGLVKGKKKILEEIKKGSINNKEKKYYNKLRRNTEGAPNHPNKN